jgi:hypothetical protein
VNFADASDFEFEDPGLPEVMSDYPPQEPTRDEWELRARRAEARVAELASEAQERIRELEAVLWGWLDECAALGGGARSALTERTVRLLGDES